MFIKDNLFFYYTLNWNQRRDCMEGWREWENIYENGGQEI